MEKRKMQVLAVSFTAAAFAVSVGFGVQGYVRAEDYRRQLDNGYRQAFTELTAAAGELDAALEKVTYATTPALFATLCAQAYATAQAAQSALGELPYGNVELEQTAAFFAKAGDYAMAMARGTNGEGVCTDENRETLRGLAAAAGELSATRSCPPPSRRSSSSWTAGPSIRRTWPPWRPGWPPRRRTGVRSPAAPPSRRWRPTSPRCPP